MHGLANFSLRDGMVLSIQTGKRSYSEPREDGLSPYDYESFEVGIWNMDHMTKV